ncbi:hypothetical protein K402DRAFT_319465, partial [Aulographum hederae CBS 113979]
IGQAAAGNSVHLGSWINWSRGPILGATITLTRRDGGLLTEFLALFVTFVGTCFFRISCFFIHSWLSVECGQDGLYHQRQAILRNAANALSAWWSFATLVRVWRGRAPRLYVRILPLIAFIVFVIGCFTIAGIFSSRMATLIGDEVLVSSSNCGILSWAADTRYEGITTIFSPYTQQKTTNAANYGQQCYGNSTRSSACFVFVNSALNVKTNLQASCPFQQDICRDSSSNLYLDTGFVDSHTDLGWNAPPEERILYRRVLHCAPLQNEGYTETVLPFNGPQDFSETHRSCDFILAFTHRERTLLSNFQSIRTNRKVECKTALKTNNLLYCKYCEKLPPIPELQRDDGQLELLFLATNGVLFTSQIDDPWFSAHKLAGSIYDATNNTQGGTSIYLADDAARVLGCVKQIQYCNPNLPEDKRCGPLTFGYPAEYLQMDLWKTEQEKERLKCFIDLTYFNEAPSSQAAMTAALLRLYDYYGFVPKLPDNQWQIEMQNLFFMNLAILQRSFSGAATGPSDFALEPWLIRPNGTEERKFCRDQVQYSNFSTVGLVVTLTLGTTIIVLSYTIESLVQRIQKWKNLDVYGRLEWTTNETLQLQRLAHEELGLGTWSRRAKDFPVTEDGEVLGLLDLSDLDHPRLRA